ncbi:MAG: cation transporter [Chloroflexi bacterium]|nr:MAG: cation transporter [Chloroflexota bacterium]
MDISRSAALTRGARLEAVTVAWMAVEAAVALAAGVAARSVLLTAFGADSIIELLSGVVLYRRLLAEPGEGAAAVVRLEARTTQISAVLLVLLCSYVVLSSVAGLALKIIPTASIPGIAVSAIAVVAMPLLARAKIRVNRVLDSPSLRADVAETVSCAFLAATTLAGLAVAMVTGWWWIEYVAALALLIWLVPEAREALQERRHNGASQGDKGRNDE